MHRSRAVEYLLLLPCEPGDLRGFQWRAPYVVLVGQEVMEARLLTSAYYIRRKKAWASPDDEDAVVPLTNDDAASFFLSDSETSRLDDALRTLPVIAHGWYDVTIHRREA